MFQEWAVVDQTLPQKKKSISLIHVYGTPFSAFILLPHLLTLSTYILYLLEILLYIEELVSPFRLF